MKIKNAVQKLGINFRIFVTAQSDLHIFRTPCLTIIQIFVAMIPSIYTSCHDAIC